jgi:large subunit ribosomal protein L1
MGNFAAFMEAVSAAKPTALKGIYLKKVTLTSTMGPGIKVDTNAAAMLRSEE